MTESIIPISPGAAQRSEQRKPVMGNPFRRKNLRFRVLAPVAIGFLILALAEPSLAGGLVGLPLVLAGAALRIWATGHLVKTAEFTVSGPYAYLRHPLYGGTLAIGCGFAVLAGWKAAVFALPALLAFFFGHYFPRKERIESARLEQLYGQEYRAYRAAVRALLPSLRPWGPSSEASGEAEKGGNQGWSLERFRENDELGTSVTVAVALAILALRPFLGV
jgi:protein-S-isoprenylcysteine O-methyltransferase Ste14